MKRKSKDDTQKCVSCSKVSIGYSKNTNSVDSFDSVDTRLFDRQIKVRNGIRGYFVKSAVTNAFIIRKDIENTPKLSDEDFRRSISNDLLARITITVVLK